MTCKTYTCPQCSGRGHVYGHSETGMTDQYVCSYCKGAGKIDADKMVEHLLKQQRDEKWKRYWDKHEVVTDEAWKAFLAKNKEFRELGQELDIEP